MKLRHQILASLGIIPTGCAPTATRPKLPVVSVSPADTTGPIPTTDPPTTTTEPPPAPTTTVTLARTTTTPPVTFTMPAPPRTTTTIDDMTDAEWSHRERILACIRRYEGDYTSSGLHEGAYQFTQSTWDYAARRAGYPEWVGSLASNAPAYVQDDVAWQLYTEQGYGPWPTPKARCAR